MGQPSKDSASALSIQHTLLPDLFEAQYVVDTYANPRVWFGCCKKTALCSGDSAHQNPMCHRLSKPLDGTRLRLELGANIAFTPVVLNPRDTQRLLLPGALLNANQLGDRPPERGLARVYVTELDFERLSDYSAIEKWSKYLHLAGVRSIRMTVSADLDAESIDRGQVMKSLGVIFGRYFIVDVGGLTPAFIELVLSYTTPRNLPVLISGLHYGKAHPCGGTVQVQSFQPRQVCEIVRSGGVITIGPNLGTNGVVSNTCQSIETVNDYVWTQWTALSQLKCDSQLPLNMEKHLAVSSNLPLLTVVDPNQVPQFLNTRWGRFAQYLAERSVAIETMTSLLGGNMLRLMRRTLPGVQPAQLLFPINHQSLTADKGIQFQWTPPKKNDPKRMAGQIFGMRRGVLVIEKRFGAAYQPWQSVKVISGDRKSLKVKAGNFRWRLVSSNRQFKVSSDWGYFSVVPITIRSK